MVLAGNTCSMVAHVYGLDPRLAAILASAIGSFVPGGYVPRTAMAGHATFAPAGREYDDRGYWLQRFAGHSDRVRVFRLGQRSARRLVFVSGDGAAVRVRGTIQLVGDPAAVFDQPTVHPFGESIAS